MPSRIEQYEQAALRGAAWLLNHQRTDGSFSDVGDGVQPYHKIPYALAISGHRCEASRVLDWVVSHAMTPEGDLNSKDVQTACNWYDRFYTYANSWIVLGAAQLGRCDVIGKGNEYILKHLDANGGLFSQVNSDTQHCRRQDIVSTSKAGSACLSAGRLHEAVLIGNWFIRLLKAQPDMDTVLYTCWDPDRELITSFPESDSLTYAVYTAASLQWFYYPGIAMEFLNKLYQITGRRKYLEASRRCFDFACRCGKRILRTDPGAIIGPAAALMYRIDSNPRCHDVAVAVGDSLVSKQTAAGFWFKQDEADSTEHAHRHLLKLEGTAEFVVWLTDIVRCLQ